MKKINVERETVEEIELLDTMLSSFVEILEEKGVITQRNMRNVLKRK